MKKKKKGKLRYKIESVLVCKYFHGIAHPETMVFEIKDFWCLKGNRCSDQKVLFNLFVQNLSVFLF